MVVVHEIMGAVPEITAVVPEITMLVQDITAAVPEIISLDLHPDQEKTVCSTPRRRPILL